MTMGYDIKITGGTGSLLDRHRDGLESVVAVDQLDLLPGDPVAGAVRSVCGVRPSGTWRYFFFFFLFLSLIVSSLTSFLNWSITDVGVAIALAIFACNAAPEIGSTIRLRFLASAR